MSELPFYISKAIDKYEKIEIDGLTFWPITVENYDLLMIARPGIEVMQQALPFEMVSLPLLSALYKIDYDAAMSGGKPSGLFSSCILLLALSLRLGEGRTMNERLKLFRFMVDQNDKSRLKSVRFTLVDEIFDITPVQFARYRPIIAAQNGIALEADDANPELVQAERDLREMNAPKVDSDISSLISTLSAFSGKEEREIYQWPVLKMNRRREAFQRIVDYAVCSINEGAGCKWKGGNPVPSLWFAKTKEGSEGSIALSDFAGGAGLRAMNNPGQKTF